MSPFQVDSFSHYTRRWLRLVLVLGVVLWQTSRSKRPRTTTTTKDDEENYSTRDDASWSVTSSNVSQRLGDGPARRYHTFIEQCNVMSLEDQVRDGVGGPDLDPHRCTNDDQQRQERNRDQPAGVYNYTELGYLKLSAPEELMTTLRTFYFTNRPLAQVEFPSVHCYQNNWEVPSQMIRLEDDTLTGGGKHLTKQVADATLASIQEWTGLTNFKSMSVYGIREYRRGSILAPHVDRIPLVVSAILNIHQQGVQEDWSLEVYGHNGMARNITLQPGEMLLYESHSIIHGRPFPFQGDVYANVFVHFEPIYDNDDDAGRDKMVPPPYVVPGSILESQWQEEQIETWALQAVLEGNVEWLHKLGEMFGWDALLQISDENGWSLIHQAVRAGHLDVVQQLLEDGAEDIRRETHYQQQPLDIARTLLGDDHAMTQFLIQHAGTHRGAYDSEPDL